MTGRENNGLHSFETASVRPTCPKKIEHADRQIRAPQRQFGRLHGLFTPGMLCRPRNVKTASHLYPIAVFIQFLDEHIRGWRLQGLGLAKHFHHPHLDQVLAIEVQLQLCAIHNGRPSVIADRKQHKRPQAQTGTSRAC
jgi:hypothetical protein